MPSDVYKSLTVTATRFTNTQLPAALIQHLFVPTITLFSPRDSSRVLFDQSSMPDPPNNTPIWARIMEREIMYHGPLPATVHVKKAVHVNKPAYHVEIPGQSDSIILDCHPLSPRGRTALGANLAKLPIESLGTKELPCVGLPPVELKYSDWEWTKPVQGEFFIGVITKNFTDSSRSHR